MRIFPKKLIACMLTVIMCISSFAFVGAEDSNAINISATETTTINTAADMVCENGVENHNSTGYYAFCSNAAATVKINVEEAGYYNVEVTGDVNSNKYAQYNILIDGEVADSFKIWGNGDGVYTVDVADIYLAEGERELKLAYVAPQGVYNYLTEIKLTKKSSEKDAIWVEAKSGTSGGNSGAAHEMFYVMVGGSVSYTVNASSAGTYKMYMKVARMDAATNEYTVTVNGTQVTGTMGTLPQNNSNDPNIWAGKQLMAEMCVVNLKEGDNTITFANNGSFMYFSYLKFDEPEEEPPLEPIGEKITILMKDFSDSSGLEPAEKITLGAGKWAAFDVDIETRGKYIFGINYGCKVGNEISLKVSVNDKEQITSTFASEHAPSAFGDAELGYLSFEKEGKFTIKIENAGTASPRIANIFIQLAEEYAIPSVEPMGEDIRIPVRDYDFAYDAIKNKDELGYDGSSATAPLTNTLWQVGNWAEYTLNITTPGTYEFGLCLGGNDAKVQKLVASVDDVEQLVADVTITEDISGSNRVDVVFGNVTFNTAGRHTFKMQKTDGGFIYVTHLFFNLTDSSEVRIPMKSYKEAFNNNTNDNHKDNSTLQIEGGYVCWRPGDKATFDVAIMTPGKYKLGIKQSGANGQTSKLKASVNGVEQFDNEGKTKISGGYKDFAEIEYGEVTFAYEGTNVIELENTGSSDGEYTIDFYLVLSEELDAGADIPDVPETTEIRLHMQNDSYEKYCNLTGANELKIEGGCVTWHGKDASSTIGDWAKFKVNIEDTGFYRFGLALSGTVGANTALRVCVDGEEKIESTQRTIKTYYGTLTDTVFGTIEFPEAGEYDLYVEHTGSAGQYVGEIFLLHLGDDLEIIGAQAGDADLFAEETVSAGADLIMINFSKYIKNSDVTGEDCKISLTDSKGNKIAISPSVIKGTAMIALKETLKADETYTLYVGEISDSVENSVAASQEFTFVTEEGDGTAFIREAKAEFDGAVASVTAKMFSSQNVGIKGREYTVYLKAPSGKVNTKAIVQGISDEDGLIEFTYTLPSDSADGTYTFILNGEYVTGDTETKAVYVSEALRREIENDLSECGDATAVESVITSNKEYLGIEPTNLLAGLVASKVYAHFTEEEVSFEDIVSTLNKFVSVEKFNQATSSNIEETLDDDANWEAISVDKVMYDSLSDEGKDSLETAILGIEDGLKADEFIDAFKEAINTVLAQDNEKIDLTLDLSDETVYAGQGIYLPIDFVEEADDIRMLSFEVEVSDEALLENTDIQVNNSASVEKTVNGNVLSVNIEFDEPVSGSDLGNIILTAPESTGNYSAELKGNVFYLYESGEVSFDIRTDILKKTVAIEVVKTPSGSNGNSSSSANSNYRPSTSGGNGGGSSVVTPPATEVYKFTDIASNHWAYPAVDYLTNLGVIDKTADKKFNPEKSISREEAVKILVIALGLTDTTAECNLKDVEKTNPYYVYIASAEKSGIIKGDDMGMFKLGAAITREDICVILHRAVSSKMNLTKSADAFADNAAISEYAKTAVYEMRGSGLINGMGNNEFAPKGDVTKAQTAKMIYEIVKAVAK